jgi:hypothetical protein
MLLSTFRDEGHNATLWVKGMKGTMPHSGSRTQCHTLGQEMKGTMPHSGSRAQPPLVAKGMDLLFWGGHYDHTKGTSPGKFEALASSCQIVNERLMKCVQRKKTNKAELVPFKQIFSSLESHHSTLKRVKHQNKQPNVCRTTKVTFITLN